MLIIPVAIWAVLPELFKPVLSESTYSEYYRYISAVSILLGAISLWFLGSKLNGGGRTVIDEETGERLVLKANHSLFFVNMEYWAIPLGLLFLAALFA
ncbi:MAG TPA: hypothetical protein VFG91_12235 [Woeseiaceae bacterium]|nr:hypothetical protein [Woeseiaceae bacterium]